MALDKYAPHDCCLYCISTGDEYADGCCCCTMHRKHGGKFLDPGRKKPAPYGELRTVPKSDSGATTIW